MNSKFDPAIDDEIRRYEEQYSRRPASLVFARLADAYRKAGEAERALALLDEGLLRHSDYLSAHIVRARVLRDLGRRAEAAAAFESVLRLDSGNGVALRALSEIALEEGDGEGAGRWLERLARAAPEHGAPVAAESPSPAAGTAEPVPLAPAPADPAAPAPADPAAPAPDGPDVPLGAGGPAAGAPPAREEIAWWKQALGEPPPSTGGSPWRDLWESDPEPPPADEGEEPDELLTRTMAELYARQGLFEEAAEICQELLRARPGDLDLAALLAEARGRLPQGISPGGGSGRGAGPAAPVRGPAPARAPRPFASRESPSRTDPPSAPGASPSDPDAPPLAGRSAAEAPSASASRAAPEPPPSGEGEPSGAGDAAGGSGRSDFFRRWLRRLGSGE